MKIGSSNDTSEDQTGPGTRLTSLALALLMVAGFTVAIAGLAPTAAADEHCSATVQDGQSIQTAVDGAAAGDTVCVEEGTYDEDVLVDKELTLLGDDATVAGTVSLEANGVTLDGFTVTGVADGAAVSTSATASGYEITNNTIRDNDLGLELRSDGALETVVADNLFLDNDLGDVARAIDTGIDGTLGNAAIEDNTFEGHTEGANSYSIQLRANQGGYNDVTIAGNSAQATILLNDVDGILVEDNEVSLAADDDSKSALFIGGNVTNAQITGNTLQDTDRGLGVFDVFAGANGALSITDNTFEDNQVHVEDGEGSLVLADVLDENSFDKLVSVNGEDAVDGSILGSIQAAVDRASAGDEVTAGAGTFEEAVLVDVADLTLTTDAGATLAFSEAEDEGTGTPALKVAADGVTVDGLTVERGNSADALIAQGIRISNSDVLVQDTTIVKDGGNDLDQGVSILDGATGTQDVELSGVTVEGFEVGVGIATQNNQGLTGVSIDDATITGNSYGVGLAVWQGSTVSPDDVSVTSSDITGNTYGVYLFGAEEDLLLSEDVTGDVSVHGSTITDNFVGVSNEHGATVDASENWWGSATGPEAQDNPLGVNGDRVEGDVDYRDWCAEESCAVTFDGGKALVEENRPFETVVAAEGQGSCQEGAQGGSYSDEAGVHLDATDPTTFSFPSPLGLAGSTSGAAFACSLALLDTKTPDEGFLTGTVSVADGTVTVDVDQDADHLAALTWYQQDRLDDENDRHEDPTSGVEADGQCVRPDNGDETGGSATITIFPEEDTVTIDREDKADGGPGDALLCVIGSAGQLDTPAGGSYLKLSVDLVGESLSFSVSTVPATDAATDAADGPDPSTSHSVSVAEGTVEAHLNVERDYLTGLTWHQQDRLDDENDRNEDPSSSVTLEGQCVSPVGFAEESGGSVTVELFSDEAVVDYRIEDQRDGGPVDALFCLVESAGHQSLPAGGSYLRASVDLADGTFTLDADSVPASDLVTSL